MGQRPSNQTPESKEARRTAAKVYRDKLRAEKILTGWVPTKAGRGPAVVLTPEEQAQKKRDYANNFYHKNKEKILAKAKQAAHNDKQYPKPPPPWDGIVTYTSLPYMGDTYGGSSVTNYRKPTKSTDPLDNI